jgi:hypothetical protein
LKRLQSRQNLLQSFFFATTLVLVTVVVFAFFGTVSYLLLPQLTNKVRHVIAVNIGFIFYSTNLLVSLMIGKEILAKPL